MSEPADPPESQAAADAPVAEYETFIDPTPFDRLCGEITFKPGETLRVKNKHYGEMYLITEGAVEIYLEKPGEKPTIITRHRGSPIGEIGFLTGRPATALVKASQPTRAFVIDDDILTALERDQPEVAAALYRQLANVSEGRQSFNLVFFSDPKQKALPVEVRVCRSPEMLLEAQRMRYEVYCGELGRTSPFADHEKKILADDLDATGYVLLAYEGDRPVGTLRLNSARDGIGALEQIYGMASSPHHPDHTGICTKFIVRKSHRYSQASFKMMATSLDFGLRTGIKASFIDCIPSLLPFYMSLGFRQSAPAFLHRENGRSIPLMFDMERYAKRVARLTGYALG